MEDTFFQDVPVGKKFYYKPFFGEAILYKKTEVRKISGIKYNAELDKKGLKQYEWFDPETPVRMIV